MASRLRSIAVPIGRVARDAWLIVGITLVLLLGLEAAYRLQGAARRVLSGPIAGPTTSVPPSLVDKLEWWPDYRRDALKGKDLKWTSYVYIRNPTFTGTQIIVDGAGHRVTPQPEGTGDRTVEVFFLGGSTTFGWFHRQAFTIPALAAQRLQSVLEPGTRLHVTNFGAPGRTFTQELIELLLQLQAGAHPDIVVFYDGINDVMATVQNGVAGLPQNEANRVEDFERGRRLEAERRPGFANAMHEWGRLGWSVAQRSELVERLRTVRAPDPWKPVPTDVLAASLARVYTDNVRLVEALGARYGFTALYVWQPALMSTGKRLTAREAWVRRPADADPEIRPVRDLHVAMPPLLRTVVPPLVGERFIDATTVFDADPLDVFGDVYGHTYERGSPPVLDVMFPQLSGMVTRASRRPAPDGRR
jgi:GDSL-like Lipase/Acylhydrolase family